MTIIVGKSLKSRKLNGKEWQSRDSIMFLMWYMAMVNQKRISIKLEIEPDEAATVKEIFDMKITEMRQRRLQKY